MRRVTDTIKAPSPRAVQFAFYIRSFSADHAVGILRTHCRHIADTRLGRLPLRSATGAAVRSWYASLDGAKPTARAHAYQLLHAVLATAVHDELLPTNPAHIARAMAAPTRRQPVILDAGEVAAVADETRPELRALILIAAWCGPRWGEPIELRREDVGPDGAVITIHRGATHRQKVCRIDTPKSGRGRRVVPPHVRPNPGRPPKDVRRQAAGLAAVRACARRLPP
jgi:integrase